MAGISTTFKDDKHPVGNVSWYEAKEFINKLNELTGESYCLPTEAEWEFAARGGLRSQGYLFAGSNQANEVAWLFQEAKGNTRPVGQKKGNELGLYDMSGNVWEWCEDDWHDNYEDAPNDGSAWVDILERNNKKVLRGGGCYSNPMKKGKGTISFRQEHLPDKRLRDLGLRLARSI